MGQKIVFVRNKGFVSIQIPVLLLMLQQIMSLKLSRMQYSVDLHFSSVQYLLHKNHTLLPLIFVCSAINHVYSSPVFGVFLLTVFGASLNVIQHHTM